MYCLVLIISLAMASPRVSRNCYTLCESQKAHPANTVPRGCDCSQSDLLNAETFSKETGLLDDSGIYFVPAEVNLYQSQFTPQPFLISNPVKFNPKISRIKKGYIAEKDFSEESTERIETYERTKTLIRVSTNDELEQPPSYLDLEIQDSASSETSLIQQDNYIQNIESAEEALVECLNLHILDYTRKYGSKENFNEFWEAKNLQLYEDLSNSDLNDKIKKYCSETQFIFEQSLDDIKTRIPKKKGNFRSVQEHTDNTSKTQESEESNVNVSTESLDLTVSASETKSTYVNDPAIGLPSLLSMSNEHEIMVTQNLNIIDTKNESTSEGLPSFNLSPTTSTEHNIDNSTKKYINLNKPNQFVTTENTAKMMHPTENLLTFVGVSKDIEYDSDTISSEVFTKTNTKINKTDLNMISNKQFLDKNVLFPISTTPINEELSFGDINVNTERSVVENKHEERTDENMKLDLDTMSSETIIKTINEINKSDYNMLSSKLYSYETTLFPILTTPLNEEISRSDVSVNMKRSMAKEQKLSTDEDTRLNLNTVASILKVNTEIDKSDVNKVSTSPVLDETTSFPTSRTQLNEELSLRGKSDSTEKSVFENVVEPKNVDTKLDLNTIPSSVTFKRNNEIDNSDFNMVTNKPILDQTTTLSTTTTAFDKALSLGDNSGNIETTVAINQNERSEVGIEFDLDIIPSDVVIKATNDTFKPRINLTGNESLLDKVPFFPTTSTSSQNETVILDISLSTERPMEELQEKRTDERTDADLNTMTSNVVLNTKIISDLNITDNGTDLDESSKAFATLTTPLHKKPFRNMHEDIISHKTIDEDITSIAYISTTPVTAVYAQSRNKFKENEIQIPEIITKECQNNEVKSFINGYEVIPNNDFKKADTIKNSSHIKINQDNGVVDDSSGVNQNPSVENTTAIATMLNNESYISGNLYFGFNQELVPVRILQTNNGKIKLGIDGNSLCEKLIGNSNSKSLLLSTLCDCVQNKMSKFNNTTGIPE